MALPFPSSFPAWAYHKHGEARLFTAPAEFAALSDTEWANYPGYWLFEHVETPAPPPPAPVPSLDPAPVAVTDGFTASEQDLFDDPLLPPQDDE
jgi:hypothetical protein